MLHRLSKSRTSVLVITVTILVATIAATGIHYHYRYLKRSQGGKMQLSSSAFANNQPIPKKYAHTHDNISPPLDISGAPNDTKSFALIVYDPDAPGGDFTHWLVWNIPITTTKFIEGNLPSGVTQGTNGFGKAKWDGPAPPSRVHHYHFVLYALDTTLDLPANTTRDSLEGAIAGHILDTTELVGTYAAD